MRIARMMATLGTTRGFIVGLGLVAVLLVSCERQSSPPPAKVVRDEVVAPQRETASPPETTAMPFSVERHPEADLRLVSYNVLWNNIFPEVSRGNSAKFARLVGALDADVWCLQEISVHPRDRKKLKARRWSADDVVKVMNEIAPRPDGASWYAHQGNDNVIVSKYPLELTATQTIPAGEREQAMALIDLPDERFSFDLYVLNNHYKCCGGEGNDPRRQRQSDAIVAWIRDARTPGDNIDLPTGTAIVIAGDLNIVGGFQPVQTLLDGDVVDEAKYGADFLPDWDDTGLADLHPQHNEVGRDDYTWRNDRGEWDPGRIDFIIYTDSVLDVARKFVLNTTLMLDEDLRAAGLKKYDVTVDNAGREFDHLPLVVDFRVQQAASGQ